MIVRLFIILFFFFSSIRRHTRCYRDWSSDVCSSDLDQLRSYLAQERPGLVHGTLSAEVIGGGRSNLTYRVTDGVSRWVVRRPPLGHVLATAHDMAREHRVITALADTRVP